MIGFQTRDFMTIRYMNEPDQRMKRYAYIQIKYRPIPKITVQNAHDGTGVKTCGMVVKDRNEEERGNSASTSMKPKHRANRWIYFSRVGV